MCSAVLSDVDDISDIDIEDAAEDLHKTMSAKPVFNGRRSIFNTTLDLNEPRRLPACQVLSDALAIYKEDTAREKQVWESFTTENIRISGQLKQVPNTSSSPSSCYKPNAEQQAYLSQAPDLQAFIRGQSVFMDDSIRFLMEFEALKNIEESLKETLEHRVQQEKNKIVARCLARR